MMWVCLSSDHSTKLAPLCDRATIGSADSNTLVIQGKGIRPLHGQFIQQDHLYYFRDFMDRKLVPIVQDSEIKVGPWTLESGSFHGFWEKFKPNILHDFKQHLTESRSPELNSALICIQKNWFFSDHLPEIVCSNLSSQFHEISLLGPVEALLQDPLISDILVERYDRIWIEREGQLLASSLKFTTEESYRIYIENLLTQAHQVLDDAYPFVDFVLSDGARAHLIGPPVTDGAYYLSIRKMRKNLLSLDALSNTGMFSKQTL